MCFSCFNLRNDIVYVIFMVLLFKQLIFSRDIDVTYACEEQESEKSKDQNIHMRSDNNNYVNTFFKCKYDKLQNLHIVNEI